MLKHKSEDYKIARNIINGKDRPKYLSRDKKSVMIAVITKP